MVNKYPKQELYVHKAILVVILKYIQVIQLSELENMTINQTGSPTSGFNHVPSQFGDKYVQTLFDTTNFRQFRQDQIITLRNSGTNSSSNCFIIDRIEHDETDTSIKNNKIVLSPLTNSMRDDSYSYENRGDFSQTTVEGQPSLISDRFKFNSINPTFHNDNSAYIKSLQILFSSR